MATMGDEQAAVARTTAHEPQRDRRDDRDRSEHMPAHIARAGGRIARQRRPGHQALPARHRHPVAGAQRSRQGSARRLPADRAGKRRERFPRELGGHQDRGRPRNHDHHGNSPKGVCDQHRGRQPLPDLHGRHRPLRGGVRRCRPAEDGAADRQGPVGQASRPGRLAGRGGGMPAAGIRRRSRELHHGHHRGGGSRARPRRRIDPHARHHLRLRGGRPHRDRPAR